MAGCPPPPTAYAAPVCGGLGGGAAAYPCEDGGAGGGGGFAVGWCTPGLCVWLGGGGGGAWPALRMDPLPWLIEEGGAGLALGGVSDGVEF
jgi:hypothetical protein